MDKYDGNGSDNESRTGRDGEDNCGDGRVGGRQVLGIRESSSGGS